MEDNITRLSHGAGAAGENRSRKKQRRGSPLIAVLVILLIAAVGAIIWLLIERSDYMTEDPANDKLISSDVNSGEKNEESGYVYYNGSMIPMKDVPANEYSAQAFFAENGRVYYDSPQSQYGIDVSSHQGEIDWQAVAADGIDFAMIRIGYRGYSQGGLIMDDFFQANIQGALDAGLDVGVYFFSQAISVEEAEEEADFVLAAIADYALKYPVVFDWESITHTQARTDNMTAQMLTDCAVAFSQKIKAAGYTPMVYHNKSQGYMSYDLEQISDYEIWLAEYDDVPTYYYNFQMWQYSSTGQVAGISTNVDMNICFNGYSGD